LHGRVPLSGPAVGDSWMIGFSSLLALPKRATSVAIVQQAKKLIAHGHLKSRYQRKRSSHLLAVCEIKREISVSNDFHTDADLKEGPRARGRDRSSKGVRGSAPDDQCKNKQSWRLGGSNKAPSHPPPSPLLSKSLAGGMVFDGVLDARGTALDGACWVFLMVGVGGRLVSVGLRGGKAGLRACLVGGG